MFFYMKMFYTFLFQDIGPVRQVSCGSTHTLAISKSGTSVWSFGAGDHGEKPVELF